MKAITFANAISAENPVEFLALVAALITVAYGIKEGSGKALAAGIALGLYGLFTLIGVIYGPWGIRGFQTTLVVSLGIVEGYWRQNPEEGGKSVWLPSVGYFVVVIAHFFSTGAGGTKIEEITPFNSEWRKTGFASIYFGGLAISYFIASFTALFLHITKPK